MSGKRSERTIFKTRYTVKYKTLWNLWIYAKIELCIEDFWLLSYSSNILFIPFLLFRFRLFMLASSVCTKSKVVAKNIRIVQHKFDHRRTWASLDADLSHRTTVDSIRYLSIATFLWFSKRRRKRENLSMYSVTRLRGRGAKSKLRRPKGFPSKEITID